MWGHDFRPDYLFIRRALEALGDPSVLGMTATATPAAAAEIATALGRELAVVRTSVVRPNLRYDVEEVGGNEDRLRMLLERLRAVDDGSVIVYARSRDSCERVARTLRGHGLRLEHYHAGLEADERSRVQDDFVSGRILGVVATTAFGMGIDKPDVRFVCLFNYPDSLESYVQMVGRGGRDGAPSETLLLASPSDATAVRRFWVGDIPQPGRSAAGVPGHPRSRRHRRPVSAARGRPRPTRPRRDARAAGIVRRGYDPGSAMRIELLPVDAGAGAVVDDLLARYAPEATARVERIVRFTESTECRHAQVAEHFGETFDTPCGACDICDPPASRAAQRAASPLPGDVAGTIVRAVERLTWPLGRRSLIAMLRGSVSAPPSARASLAFGVLEAASDAEVKRWIKALEAAGALVEVETTDGFRVLNVVGGCRPAVARAEERRPGGRFGRRAPPLLAADAVAGGRRPGLRGAA